MRVYVDTLAIKGAGVGPESILPELRAVDPHKVLEIHENMPESLKKTMGQYCGQRVLPYKMQNNYDRNKTDMNLKTVVLENEILKATFLPEYGGRLYSLYHKRLNRELLSVNPVFQPANLGLRNAWFSGGIEWNMAQFGHTYLSCDHVHFGLVEDEEPFVRLYEYERTKQLFYQIDFHLPRGSEHLYAYTKIINLEEDTPLYYWSNTAVSEMKRARVFSAADEVIYIKPYLNDKGQMVNTFAYGQVPNLQGIQGDVTYPRNFERSNEYFYQIDASKRYPWEAVGYEDDFLFYECSTQPLRYRKMFCWGIHQGGTKWQEFLSRPDGDKYVEIQAGLFPSQLHQEILPAGKSLEFMQVFGGKSVDSTYLYQDYQGSRDYVEGQIFTQTLEKELEHQEDQLKMASNQPVSRVLHTGRPYGALALMKLNQSIESMDFSTQALGEVKVLMDLMSGKAIQTDMCTMEYPYMADMAWYDIMSNSDDDYAVLQKSLILWENLRFDDAVKTLSGREMNSLMHRTLGRMHDLLEDQSEAIDHYNLAYEKLGEMKILSYKAHFLTEYIMLLNKYAMYEKAWEILEHHKTLDHEELNVQKAIVAFELNKFEVVKAILKSSLSRIREGDNTLVTLWYRLKALEMGLSFEEAIKAFQAPDNIDFRMV